jgi:hypothetical protein
VQHSCSMSMLLWFVSIGFTGKNKKPTAVQEIR